jgi:transcriptional regulator with XRE-family HTH domain
MSRADERARRYRKLCCYQHLHHSYRSNRGTTITSPTSHPSATQLGELIRSRRDALQPADVGLPSGRRRRTPGLRREEVALLAAISPTYLAMLEQGRDIRPSAAVLDALADALRLTPVERAHIHQLAHGPARRPDTASEVLAPGLAALVDRLDPDPAYVTGRRWDLLASNRAARMLWTDWTLLPDDERNIIWWTFTDPAARTILGDWHGEAAALLGRLRAAAARHPDDSRFDDLIARLHAASPEARVWWPRHHIAPIGSGSKRLRHPQLGELRLDVTVLYSADDPEQKLVVFTPSAEDRARLAALLAAPAS